MKWCIRNKQTNKNLKGRKFATRGTARRNCATLNRAAKSTGKGNPYTVVSCR